uniref:Uncharacterized protein n=1 Tax=Oryza glumipatula TaxID=40148 RepID=A0A0E0BIN2_9ORYZ
MALSGERQVVTRTSTAWQHYIIDGFGWLGDAPSNSNEMACDATRADDALRASSGGAPAGVLFEKQADECEEDSSVDEGERTSAELSSHLKHEDSGGLEDVVSVIMNQQK